MKTKTSIVTLARAFFAFLVMNCIFSCSNIPDDKGNIVKNQGIQILTIDNCEYVWVKEGYGAGLTHKGNCKYCTKRALKNH